LSLFIIACSHCSIAGNQNYGPLIQRQSKKINSLEDRIIELEYTVRNLQSQLDQKDTRYRRSSARSDNILISPNNSVLPSIGEGANIPSELDKTQNKKQFFGKKNNIAADKAFYDIALSKLKGGSHEDSEKLFAEFIQKFPNSKLQSNAMFWYGESFYRREIFNKAAINFLKTYKKYPKGSKAADSLLKLSFSLASLNKNKEACSMLNKLKSEFPKRPISSIKRAKDAREKFGCGFR
jgi:tol-pal system protein YbgF